MFIIEDGKKLGGKNHDECLTMISKENGRKTGKNDSSYTENTPPEEDNYSTCISKHIKVTITNDYKLQSIFNSPDIFSTMENSLHSKGCIATLEGEKSPNEHLYTAACKYEKQMIPGLELGQELHNDSINMPGNMIADQERNYGADGESHRATSNHTFNAPPREADVERGGGQVWEPVREELARDEEARGGMGKEQVKKLSLCGGMIHTLDSVGVEAGYLNLIPSATVAPDEPNFHMDDKRSVCQTIF